MANGLFDVYKESLLGAGAHTGIDVTANVIAVFLIDTADDDPSLSLDADLADLVAAALIGDAGGNAFDDGGVLGTKTTVDGVFDAANTTITAVTGDVSEELLVYKTLTSLALSPCIVSFDTFGGGMPVTPNGGDIIVAWNGSGIYAL